MTFDPHTIARRPQFVAKASVIAIAVVLAALPSIGRADAGAPLPRCSVGSLSFYQARYLKSGTDNSSTPPTIALDQVTCPQRQAMPPPSRISGRGKAPQRRSMPAAPRR
jgi:hypothetical protein